MLSVQKVEYVSKKVSLLSGEGSVFSKNEM